ncbi:hypothetical protein ACB092_01G223600 [Castanea dentata]
MVDSTQPNPSHNLGFILNTLFFYWKRDANKMLSEVQNRNSRKTSMDNEHMWNSEGLNL